MIDDLAVSIAGSWLISATIKGSVIIALVAAIQLLIGHKLGPRWRHALWLLVIIRLAIPVAPASSFSVFNLLSEAKVRLHEATQIAAPMVVRTRTPSGQGSHPAIIAIPPRMPQAGAVLVGIWLSVALLLLLRAGIASLRLQRAVRRARRAGEVVDARLLALVNDAKARLGITRSVLLVETNLVEAPALHGIVRPVLLMPAGLHDTFDDAELRHVFLHELWHLRRADVAVNWILSTTQAIHWFNPFVWFALARIREERELACDELALSCLEEEERRGYGRTILKLLERFRGAAPIPALVGIVNHKQQMKRRMQMIATFRNRTRFSILFVAVTAFVGAVAMTDAVAGEQEAIDRKIMRRMELDPATQATLEKMHQLVSVNVTNATLSELLSAVSGSTGVTIAQSPDITTSRAQQARFTINAQNIPAHLLLMEALSPFELMPQPGANGVTIGSGHGAMMHKIHVRHAGSPEAAADAEAHRAEHKVFVRSLGADEQVTKDVHELHVEGPGGENRRFSVQLDGNGPEGFDAEGNLHRELKTTFRINGVDTEGALTLNISAPPAAR